MSDDDKDVCEEHGVRIEQDFKFDYVSRGGDEEDGTER